MKKSCMFYSGLAFLALLVAIWFGEFIGSQVGRHVLLPLGKVMKLYWSNDKFGYSIFAAAIMMIVGVTCSWRKVVINQEKLSKSNRAFSIVLYSTACIIFWLGMPAHMSSLDSIISIANASAVSAFFVLLLVLLSFMKVHPEKIDDMI